MVAVIIAAIVKKLKEKIHSVFQKVQKVMIWNGIIQSLNIAFLGKVLVAFAFFKLLDNDDCLLQPKEIE